MPIIIYPHRIFEQDEVGADLTGYDLALDKSGNLVAEKIGAERIALTGTELDGVNGYQAFTGRKWFDTRLLFKQVTAQASANNLVLGEGQAFSINTIANEIQTINNNNWTGGSIIFLEVLTGQQIAHNAADYGLGNYNGILLNCGSDWTATQKTVLLLKYNNVNHKWDEVNGTSIITGTSGINYAGGEITNERVFVTSADIEAGYKVITLLYSIAPETHVFAFYRSIPLSISQVSGSVSYTEKTQTVTVTFSNTQDFGEENPYIPQIGDDIVIRYTKYQPIPTVENGAYVDSVVGTDNNLNANFEITVLPDDADTVAIVNWTFEDSSGVIETGNFTIDTSLTHVHNLNFADLADEDYTLTAWVDVGEEQDDTVTILATVAKFQKVSLTATRTSATTIEVVQVIKNIGNASGEFSVFLTLENTDPVQVATSNRIAKTIPGNMNATAAYVYEFTGVSNIEYDAFSKCDDTIFLYDVAGDFYTRI